jgi:hypothetical protein
MLLWARLSTGQDAEALGSPFTGAKDLLSTIDSVEQGEVLWEAFQVTFTGEKGPNSASWQNAQYEVYYRNPDTVIKSMLENPDFDGLIDYQPYKEFSASGLRRYNEFMSGLWAWTHTVCDPL